jgi:hypothetical protein
MLTFFTELDKKAHFLFLLLCWVGVHCGIYRSSYYISNIIFEFTISIILLYLPSPIPGIVSTGIIIPFTYMCTQYLYYIHPPTLFPYFFSPSHKHQPPNPPQGQLMLKKKNDVCLRKLHREFPCDISMYVCIITRIG